MGSFFRVLVIEDNNATCTTLQNALNRLGCQVKTSVTAEQGIEELKKEQYDAVFAELCVREQGGRGVARWVKTQSPSTRCFLVTSWKGELEQSLLQMEGIHGIIRKPLIFKEIRDKIIEHFG
jgi:response regulator RpfG family c-di-GMP phosphodiesterase